MWSGGLPLPEFGQDEGPLRRSPHKTQSARVRGVLMLGSGSTDGKQTTTQTKEKGMIKDENENRSSAH